MGKYILKRILLMIPVLLGVAILIFTIMYFVPGDPTEVILGENASVEAREALRIKLGLNDGYFIRLFRYLDAVFLHLDFGESYISGLPVASQLFSRLPRTLLIGIFSLVLTAGLGIPFGISAAVHEGKTQDRFLMVLTLIGMSMPDFWIGLLMILLFALKLGWLPSQGIGGFKYYIMPIICCSLGGIAGIARQTRAAMLETIRSDYVTTAKAKGVNHRGVIWGHVLPNALIPIITEVGGRLGMCISGTIIAETLFSIPGVGLYLMGSINNRDYPAIQGSVIILAFFAVSITLLVDIVYAFADPRIKARYERKKVS